MRFFFSGPRIMGVRAGIVTDRIGGSNQSRKPAATQTGSYVYVIRGEHNLVKIGVTTSPPARLAQLKTGSAFPIEFSFLGFAEMGAYEIEQEAHRLLAKQRCNGEWFDVAPELAVAAIAGAAAKLGKPLSLANGQTVQGNHKSHPGDVWIIVFIVWIAVSALIFWLIRNA